MEMTNNRIDGSHCLLAVTQLLYFKTWQPLCWSENTLKPIKSGKGGEHKNNTVNNKMSSPLLLSINYIYFTFQLVHCVGTIPSVLSHMLSLHLNTAAVALALWMILNEALAEGNDKWMTESNIASVTVAVSISELWCVHAARNISWSPGVPAEVWRGQRSRGVILICVINTSFLPYFVLYSSTNHGNSLLFAPQLPAQLHRPPLTLLWPCCQVLSRSLSTSPTGIWTSKTPKSIWSIFISHSCATGR